MILSNNKAARLITVSQEDLQKINKTPAGFYLVEFNSMDPRLHGYVREHDRTGWFIPHPNKSEMDELYALMEKELVARTQTA